MTIQNYFFGVGWVKLPYKDLFLVDNSRNKIHGIFLLDDFITIFEESSEGIGFVDIKGRWIKVNRSLCHLLGYEEKELINLDITEIIHPDYLLGCLNKRDKLLNDELVSYVEHISLISKSGKTIHVVLSSILLRNSDGEPRFFVLQFKDITFLTSVEEELRAITEELESIYDSITDALLVVDNFGRITKANSGFTTMFGWEEQEVIGKPLTETISTNIEEEQHLLNEVSKGHVIKNYKCTKITKTGKLLNVSISIAPLHNKTGEIIGSVGILRDITEILMMNEVMNRAEKLNLVGQMTASITHEIRNPMAVIRGFVQLLRKNTDLDEVKKEQYYNLIIEELDRTNSLITDFLSLSQTRMVAKKHLDLNDIIRSLSPILKSEANLKGIDLNLLLTPGLPRLLLNDREIKQLLLNLIQNSADALHVTGGKITVHTTFSEEENRVVLQIIDNGFGIPKDKIHKLFEPFYTSKETGTGLGLAVCKSICDSHEATIEFDSEINCGTTVTIKFNVQPNID